MSTELTTGHEAEAWALRQRKAKALADSDLVPKEYRGNLPNVLIAIDMADRLNASPLMVMQNLVIVHGKPTWSATFMIATVNQSGRFSPLRYDVSGDDPHDKAFRCRAVAIDRESGQPCEGEWITWKMVDGEGWSTKNGSKWKTMPGQMFRYRAASFWTRAFAPEVSMGIYTDDEVRDMRDVTPAPAISAGTSPAAMAAAFALTPPPATVAPAHDAETGEVAGDWTPSDDDLADIRARELALDVPHG